MVLVEHVDEQVDGNNELEAGRALRDKRVHGMLGRRVEWFVVYRHTRW